VPARIRRRGHVIAIQVPVTVCGEQGVQSQPVSTLFGMPSRSVSATMVMKLLLLISAEPLGRWQG